MFTEAVHEAYFETVMILSALYERRYSTVFAFVHDILRSTGLVSTPQ